MSEYTTPTAELMKQLDPYTLLATAYRELSTRKTRPDAEHLFRHANHAYFVARDELITHWWETSTDYCTSEGLAELEEDVLDQMWEVDSEYARDMVTSEEEWADVTAGYGAAVLTWYSLVNSGKVDAGFPLTLEQVEEWLAQNDFPVREGQMSLFLGV